jgi:hypothetical protein
VEDAEGAAQAMRTLEASLMLDPLLAKTEMTQSLGGMGTSRVTSSPPGFVRGLILMPRLPRVRPSTVAQTFVDVLPFGMGGPNGHWHDGLTGLETGVWAQDLHHGGKHLFDGNALLAEARCGIGCPQSLGFVLAVEHLVDHVRSEILTSEARDREEVRRLVLATVQDPPDEVLGSGRAFVVATGSPQDPLLGFGMVEGQEFLSVGHAVPADGAIPVGCYPQGTIRGNIHRPGHIRRGLAPPDISCGIIGAQIPVRP